MGDSQLNRLERRVDELDWALSRSLPLMLCGALLFVPVFSALEQQDDNFDRLTGTGQTVTLLHLIAEPGAHGGMAVTIVVLTILTALTLLGAAALTLGQLRVPEPIREASLLGAFATVSAVALLVVTLASDGPEQSGVDDFQPRWTYLLVIIAAVWIGVANSDQRPKHPHYVDWRP